MKASNLSSYQLLIRYSVFVRYWRKMGV